MKEIVNKKLLVLTQGEITRSVKYKVLPIGIFLSFIWLAIIFFMRKNVEQIENIMPLLIYMDTTIMSIMLVGAILFFEKSEGSIQTLFVVPTKTLQIIISKVVCSAIIGIVSGIVVSVGSILLTDVKIHLVQLLLSVLLVSLTHGVIGLALAMTARDFNSMLMKLVIYNMIFALPPMLLQFDILPDFFDYILLISPCETANILYNACVVGGEKWYMILISVVYLTVLPVILIKYYILPRFVEHMMRG